MQLTSLLALAYAINAGTVVEYDLRVQFTGMIPILGGNEGSADVRLGVRVEGQKAEASGLKISSELTKAEIFFNAAKLPLDLENVRDFFPKTTVETTTLGKILKTDAPDIQLPVRLPGLDVKRFPDISYMMLEFPAEGIEAGKPWSFQKAFGGSDVKYTCILQSQADGVAKIGVEIDQKYTVLEDSAMQVVPDKTDAENEVTTSMKATGTVQFSIKEGFILSSKILGTAVSQVKPLNGGENSERKLNIEVTLARKELK